MATLRFYLGILGAFLLIFIGFLMEGGYLADSLAITAIMIVFGSSFGIAIMGYGIRGAWSGFKYGLLRVTIPDKRAAESAVGFWDLFGHAALLSGLMGNSMGLQHVMSVLDQPKKIGPGIAVAFVPILYGLGFKYLVTDAITESLTERANAADLSLDASSSQPPSRLAYQLMGGLFLAAFMTCSGLIRQGGYLTQVLDLAAMLIVGVAAAAFTGSVYPIFCKPNWLKMLGFSAGSHITNDEHTQCVKKLNFFGNTVLATGALGACLGLLHVLSILDQPALIGPGIAVALLAPIYAAALKLITLGMGHAHAEAILDRDTRNGLRQKMKSNLGFWMLLSQILFLLFTLFVVLYALKSGGTCDTGQLEKGSEAVQENSQGGGAK